MARIIPLLMRSEKRVRLVVGWLLLILVPPFLALAVMAGKFQGLREPAAADRAQLARRIAEGRGFTTDVVRPLSRVFHPDTDLTNHPDLYNAPVYPLALAAVFWVTGAGDGHKADRVVAGFGAALWLISFWLVFLLAKHWFGFGVAILTAFLYGCNAAVSLDALEGSVQPLLAIFVVTALWLGVKDLRGLGGHDQGGSSTWSVKSLSWARLFFTGLVCTAAALTHYLMTIFVVVFGIYVVAGQRRRLRALGAFLLGALALGIPWGIRNFLVAGSPFFSLYWYEVFSYGRQFPGDSVFQVATAPPSPFLYLMSHPWEMMARAASRFSQVRWIVWQGVSPLVGVLLLVTLFSNAVSRRWRRLLIFAVGSLSVSLAMSCLTRPELALVGAWLPLFAMSAAAYASEWIQERVKGYDYGNLRSLVVGSWQSEADATWKHSRLLWYLKLGPRPHRAVAYAAMVLVVFLPLALFLKSYRPLPNPMPKGDVELLQKHVPRNATILTNVPAHVAWYAQRRAVWLFEKEETLAAFVKACGPPAASYVTDAVMRSPYKGADGWWSWLASKQGIYRELEPAEPMPEGATVRFRASENAPHRTSPELERALAETRKNPTSPEAYLQLGSAYLQLGRLREAFEAFSKVRDELDRYNLQARFGQSEVITRLDFTVDWLGIARQALRLNPDDPIAMSVLEAADKCFKAALDLYPRNTWLLIQAGMCKARMRKWNEAEKYYRQAAATAPKDISRLLLGTLFMEQQLWDKAFNQFDQLVAEQKDNPTAYIARGEAHAAQGRWKDALADYVKASELQPNRLLPHLQAGLCSVKLGDLKQAALHFRKALQLAPSSQAAAFGLADVCLRSGNETEAMQIYERMLADNPDQPVAANNLANLYAEHKKDYARALELAQRVVNAHPRYTDARDTLGWIYHLAGNHNEAVKHLRDAVTQAPNVALYRYHLGKALLAKGATVEALESLRTALTLGLPDAEKRDAENELAKSLQKN